MAYQPIVRPANLDNIELETRYDPAAYNDNYAPPPGHPPSQSDSRIDDDRKPLVSSTTKSSQQPVGNNWPVAAQMVAAMTPLRAGLMVFDAVLASMPIMFVGKFSQLLLAWEVLSALRYLLENYE